MSLAIRNVVYRNCVMTEIQQDYHQEAIFDFLKSAGLLLENDTNELVGQVIPRDLLVSQHKYEECLPKLILLKSWMSSSRLSCLQSTAKNSQRWPLLNAVRQILRLHNFKMTPFRLSDGYAKDGKKIIRRYFMIEPFKTCASGNGSQSNEQDDKIENN